MSDVSAPGATLEGALGLELKFEDLYKIERKLRSGSYGTVYVTKHVLTGDEFAVKVIDRA
jgi:serine/threonine protein kinase